MQLHVVVRMDEDDFLTDSSNTSDHDLFITIAGITKQFRVRCIHFSCRGQNFIQGSKSIKFSDFNLSPPERLNGIIKVRDELRVDFGFIINFNTGKSVMSQ